VMARASAKVGTEDGEDPPFASLQRALDRRHNRPQR
jgi:hypothetical protein